MKKAVIALCLCVLIAGCGSGAAEEVSGILDLTEMSSKMVYGAVFDIMNNPDNYLGQTMKIDGVYAPSYYGVTDQTYHYVVIADALACCQQGIEFICEGGGDYPAEGDAIEIVGVFGKYEELGETYYYLLTDGVVHI